MKGLSAIDLPPGLAGERWARAIVESITDGFLALDADWAITYLNRRGAEILAPLLGDTDVRGQDFWRTFPEVADTAFGEAFRRAARTGQPQNVEGHYAPLDSWFDVRCYPHEDGIAIHFLDIGPAKRREAALRDSEARASARVAELELLYREAPLGLGLLDQQLKFARINAALADMNGFSIAEHLGRSVWDLVPDLKATAEPVLRGVLETGERVSDVRIVGETPARPGEVREWKEQFYPFRNSDGTILGVGIVCEEVTEQRVAAAALAESEALFRATFENAAVGFAQVAPDGRWLRVNRVLADILGYAPATLLAMRFQDVTHPDDLDADLDLLADVLAGRRDSYRIEKRYIRADGRIVHADLAVGCVRDDSGTVAYFISTVQDISARKQAELALAQSEQRFRALADNISQLAWIADRDWSITWYNQRWYDFTGTTPDEVMGWAWQRVHHPDHVDRVVASIRHSHATGEPWEDTFPLRGRDGDYRWFLSRAQPIRDATGAIALWFGTNTDITEQLAREAQVRLLMREVNHRSKNMLAVVHAVARQTLATSPEDFVARFDERIQALAASHDLLVANDWRGVDLGELVRSQLAHFADLVGERITIAGPPVRLTAAAAQMIGMVVHELATNAGKYGALRGPEGRVAIAWACDEERFSLAWTEGGGPAVREPQRQGFGSRVTGQMARTALSAAVTIDYRPTGLAWRLEAPASRIIDPQPTPQAEADA